LLVSQVPAAAAGVFTRSSVVGAPVTVNRARIRSGRGRAIVANSGCSNVAMGARGLRDAHAMAALSARVLGCSEEDVFIASTGVIGEPLPMAKLKRGIVRAGRALAASGLADAAAAIMTTDTVPKLAATRTRVGGRMVSLAGIAKGSGMIEPNLGTMLAFVLTDAAVAPPYLRRVLRDAADESFNRVTIDGEGSTSDTALLLANGVAENPLLHAASSPGAQAFTGALREVCQELAKAIARDGEGATKLVTVRVQGARNRPEAIRAAKRVANSVLVKTALFGGDANWGRILQTIGAAGVGIRLARTQISLAGVGVFRRGASAGATARREAQRRLRSKEVEITVALGAGRGEATVWTCDLSYDYVRINAEYRT
jgi:glutamate N-acetyltransferase/amino-acid N-acetyltransferase